MMKDLIKNDDAVSVVVGSILILAVLVTFMSVVTSSWVPVYEGNAESDHSDQTYKTFMDLHKQIEFADEFSRSTAIDLGTDEMSFIQNSNSVGYLEVNGSDGAMFITANLTTDAASSDVGFGLSVVGMDTNQTNPITNFSFDFTQLNPYSDETLDEDFIVQIRTSTLNRWITLYNNDSNSYSGRWGGGGRRGGGKDSNEGNKELGIILEYGLNPKEKWVNTSLIITSFTSTDSEIYVDNGILYVNMLTKNTSLTLIEPIGQNVTINDKEYNTLPGNNTALLHDLIQHYMRQPGDGTGGDYYLSYVQYSGVLEGHQYFTYNTTQDSAYIITKNGEMITVLDNFKVGGGTLSLESDYNFMVDQSYIYDSGAVILKQDDGAVFKTAPHIAADADSGNLTLTLKSTVLKGEYQASGNGMETLYTALDGNVYEVSGVTDDITIVKNTTPEHYDLWFSYFTEISDVVDSSNAFYNLTNDTNKQQLVLRVNSTTPDITLTVQRKEIIIS